MVWVFVWDVDGIEIGVGIFRGKKGKRKMERKMERMDWEWNEN